MPPAWLVDAGLAGCDLTGRIVLRRRTLQACAHFANPVTGQRPPLSDHVSGQPSTRSFQAYMARRADMVYRYADFVRSL